MRGLNSIIDSMLRTQDVKSEINNIYETHINTLHEEMRERHVYRDINASSNRAKNRTKPYWNDELKKLFKRACDIEKKDLKLKVTMSENKR